MSDSALPAKANAPRPPDLPGVGAFVARHRRNVLTRKVAGLCKWFLGWYNNASYDFATNGEAFVLETLAGFRPSVILDVGANVGDWSTAAKGFCRTAAVHAFEIAEPTFRELVETTRALPNVRCLNVGLSDQEGTVPIRHYADYSYLTTATAYPHGLPFTMLQGQVITGDSYVESENITHIDLLKIDVEGMEERVLRGFDGTLKRGIVDLVQFEYGRANIFTRFLLRDFHEFFGERGYQVGKVYPNFIDFRPYDPADEDFVGPNYVACRADSSALLAALGGRPSRGRR